MKRLQITLKTAAENLALDEALLDLCDAADSQEPGFLRHWELPHFAVVMGRGSHYQTELNVPRCEELGVEVVRRSSGGLAIMAGPGCLMYSVALPYARYPQLRDLDTAHRFILDRIVAALSDELSDVTREGTSDLVWRGRKFSGNSLRCKRNALLYHGTLLYDFPLETIGQVLNHPPREPSYRNQRVHGDFITNLPLGREQLFSALDGAFPTMEVTRDWPQEQVRDLMESRYGQASWHQGR